MVELTVLVAVPNRIRNHTISSSRFTSLRLCGVHPSRSNVGGQRRHPPLEETGRNRQNHGLLPTYLGMCTHSGLQFDTVAKTLARTLDACGQQQRLHIQTPRAVYGYGQVGAHACPIESSSGAVASGPRARIRLT